MASFRRNFKPTKDEKLKDFLYLYHLNMVSKENQDCCTCVNKNIIETYNIGGVKDFYTECNLNFNEGISDKNNCEKYKCDNSNFDDIIDCIKNLLMGD